MKLPKLFICNIYFELASALVTVQTRAWPLSALNLQDSTICAERNRFLLTGFQHWVGGAESPPTQIPLLPETQHFPCSPKGYKSKPCPEVSISLSVHQPATQTVLHSSECISELSSHSCSFPQNWGARSQSPCSC